MLDTKYGTECIVGYRVWQFARPHFLLDLRSNQVGMPRERWEAACDAGHEHMAPDPECTCGFYATRTLEAIEEQVGYARCMTAVYGEVYMWGRVIVGKNGYRAQYMYPKRLVVGVQRLEHLVGYLQDVYGVPVEYDEQPKVLSYAPSKAAYRPAIPSDSLKLAAIDDTLPHETRLFAMTKLRTRLVQQVSNMHKTIRSFEEQIEARRARIVEAEKWLGIIETMRKDVRGQR